jgi:cell division protein FtsW
LLAVTEPYRLARLTSFMHPFADPSGTDYHSVESIYALASGGLFGVGIGEGTSKYWVPNANSDFVFSIIGEELGLLGAVAVLALFALLAYSGMRVARRSADPFVRLVAGAATIWLCGQAVINIGYVTALLPVTGIPLPFISAGGTSLLASFLVLGMLVSFARHEAPAVSAARRDERLGQRSRTQRWLRIPVPRPYQPPKRRPRAPTTRTAPARSAPARTAAKRSQPTRTTSTSAPRLGPQYPKPRAMPPQRAPMRATGTDGRRRSR